MKTKGLTARQRSQRRRRSRGATMFLVTLIMTLLTAMGIFASRAAGLTELGTGYDRLNEQTHYVLQHGMALATKEVGRAPEAYANRSTGNTVLSGQCFANNGQSGVSYPCAKFNLDSLTASMPAAQKAGNVAVIPPLSMPPVVNQDPGLNIPGSLGPAPLYPRMYLELSDIGPVGRPPAGTSVGKPEGPPFQYLQASFTAWGQVGPYPLGGPTNVCSDPEKGAALLAARESGRVFVVFGPVPK
jgi:hypothetical protein